MLSLVALSQLVFLPLLPVHTNATRSKGPELIDFEMPLHEHLGVLRARSWVIKKSVGTPQDAILEEEGFINGCPVRLKNIS